MTHVRLCFNFWELTDHFQRHQRHGFQIAQACHGRVNLQQYLFHLYQLHQIFLRLEDVGNMFKIAFFTSWRGTTAHKLFAGLDIAVLLLIWCAIHPSCASWKTHAHSGPCQCTSWRVVGCLGYASVVGTIITNFSSHLHYCHTHYDSLQNCNTCV